MRSQQILGEYLMVVDGVYVCRRCGHRYCSVDDNWKRYARLRESPCGEEAIGAPVQSRADGALVFRELFCPGCATEVATEVTLAGAPLRWSFRPLEVAARHPTPAEEAAS